MGVSTSEVTAAVVDFRHRRPDTPPTNENSAVETADLFASPEAWVYDGPMETRIEYETELKLDREMSIFALCDSAAGRRALTALYRRDAEVALGHGRTIVLNAPTYRASPAHAERMGYREPGAVANINNACLKLVDAVRQEFGPQSEQIVVTAPVGPKHAGYHPGLDFDLSAAEAYHSVQAAALADGEVDYISIAAMPGAVEAHGAALAVAQTGLPYTVGFILGPDAQLLDGAAPEALIEAIDATAPYPPLFYVLACTHASVCRRLLDRDHPTLGRIQGIKANGSSIAPDELLALDHAVADPPDRFSADLLSLGRERGFRIYGGCCGTDTAHLNSLCRQLNAGAAPANGI